MSEWLAMGGYAVYVWGSFLAAGVAVAWNVASPILRRRAVLRALVDSEPERRR